MSLNWFLLCFLLCYLCVFKYCVCFLFFFLWIFFCPSVPKGYRFILWAFIRLQIRRRFWTFADSIRCFKPITDVVARARLAKSQKHSSIYRVTWVTTYCRKAFTWWIKILCKLFKSCCSSLRWLAWRAFIFTLASRLVEILICCTGFAALPFFTGTGRLIKILIYLTADFTRSIHTLASCLVLILLSFTTIYTHTLALFYV